jgi:Ser/Thr protein kinase RdoA (MazF antagonist)
VVFDVLNDYFQYHHYLLMPSQTRQCVVAAGQALGALHTALRLFTPVGHHPNGFQSRTGERWRDWGWYQAQLDQVRNAAQAASAAPALRQTIHVHAQAVEATLRDLDATLAAAALPRCIIHGDYGPYNLLFKRGAPVVVLDWELARLDWRLVDLATALHFFAHNRVKFRWNNAQWLLDGYRRACAINADELHVLPLVWQFVTLRRVIVCWQRFAQTHDHHWLAEAHTKLALAQWIHRHQQRLSRLGTVK